MAETAAARARVPSTASSGGSQPPLLEAAVLWLLQENQGFTLQVLFAEFLLRMQHLEPCCNSFRQTLLGSSRQVLFLGCKYSEVLVSHSL